MINPIGQRQAREEKSASLCEEKMCLGFWAMASGAPEVPGRFLGTLRGPSGGLRGPPRGLRDPTQTKATNTDTQPDLPRKSIEIRAKDRLGYAERTLPKRKRTNHIAPPGTGGIKQWSRTTGSAP